MRYTLPIQSRRELMAILPSTRLSPYEIHAASGPGGMGEVYRAPRALTSRTIVFGSGFGAVNRKSANSAVKQELLLTGGSKDSPWDWSRNGDSVTDKRRMAYGPWYLIMATPPPLAVALNWQPGLNK